MSERKTQESDDVREERRYFSVPDLEVRAEDGDGFVVRGHASTFNEPYEVGGFLEQVDPGAFDGSLDDPDVMALWNHNDDNVLGSVGSGTLRLSTDDRGLMTETEFPESATREREAIERGDVRKMSFGFRTMEDSWKTLEDGTELRTLLDVRLFDVSPVAFPANPNTDLEAAHRSRQRWKESRDGRENAWKMRATARKRALDLASA